MANPRPPRSSARALLAQLQASDLRDGAERDAVLAALNGAVTATR